MLHHLTLWVPDIVRAERSWGWLLGHLGFEARRPRPGVLVFRHAEGVTVVLEESPDMVPGMLYSRMRPGLNHMAFTLRDEETLRQVEADAAEWGWAQIASASHPMSRGSQVLFLEDRDGFEVELVVASP